MILHSPASDPGRGPAPDPAPFPGRLQALFGPLDDPLPLKLSDRRKNVKHEPPRRGGRVDVLPEGPEPGATGLDQVYNLQEVRKRRLRPIDLRYS